MVFATPSQLEAYTKGAIRADDPRADIILRGASAAIRRRAGWHISPARSELFTLDGQGTDILQLPTLRLNSVTSVTVDGVTLDPSEYEWSALGLLRRKNGACWGSGFRSVTVAVNHGFMEVPDLGQVVLQVSANALSSPTGATREQAGQVAMSWATTAPGVAGGLTLLERDLATVDSYRLPGRL